MALLRRQIELSMRPSDKGPEWFDPYEDLFEQYIDCDPFQLSDITIEPSSSDDLDNFFDISDSSNGSHNADTSSIPDLADETQRLDEEDVWKDLHRLSKQATASPVLQGESASVYPGSRGKAAASDSEIISLDDYPDLQLQPNASSSSTPVSPSPTFGIRSKKSVEKSYTTAKGRNPSGICKSPRKHTPRMMSPQRHRSGYQEAWARRIETAADKLNLQFAMPNGPLTNGPLSPPPSGEVPQGEYSQPTASQHDDNPWLSPTLEETVSPLSTTFAPQNYSHLTPLQTPTIIDTATFSRRYEFGPSYQPQDTADPSKIFSSPPPSARIARAAWPQPSPTTAQTFDYISASPSLQTPTKVEEWWQSSPTPNATMPPPEFQQIHVPLGNSMRVDMSQNGLMISCEPSEMQSPPFINDPSQGPIVYPGHDYPHLPQRIPWRDRTPSSSPPPITPTRTRPSHSRSRSTNHRRSKSSGAHSRATSMGFVNFTPDDSRKILTGVAPSGSSKTKARREKEAAEKRRKLSEAAIRAVRDAGGDVERLRDLALP